MTIYLDNSATTPVRQEVIEAMLPYLDQKWGNPSSMHAHGRQAKEALDKAREQVAALLNAQSVEEVSFSTCGTMSNNVALLGRARFAEANGHGRHLITSAIEHPSVMGPCKYLESCGWKVTFLSVDKEGFVDLADLKKEMTKDTSIVSIMWANNEIGTLQPIEDIAQLCAEREIFFHTDAVQVPGKVAIDMTSHPVSTLALSGHKFHAPKGVGVLYVRRLQNLMPIVFGGGQEQGLLPGTEGLANIVALGCAAELAHKELEANREFLKSTQKILVEKLSAVPGVKLTGASDLDKRLPGHVSLVLPGAQGEALVMRADLKGISVSSGSACHKGIIEPSQVLRALGLSDREALGSLRISSSKLNSIEECKKAAETLASILTSTAKTASVVAS